MTPSKSQLKRFKVQKGKKVVEASKMQEVVENILQLAEYGFVHAPDDETVVLWNLLVRTAYDLQKKVK